MNADKPLRIAVIGGDGTGPEVAAEGLDGVRYAEARNAGRSHVDAMEQAE